MLKTWKNRIWVGAILASCVWVTAATPAQGRRSSQKQPADRSIMALQVALDRAGISPGVVDGRAGAQTTQALSLFQQARGLDVTGTLDDPSRKALGLAETPPTQSYTVTAEDLAGPFVERIPEDLVAQGTLATLGYTSVAELLAERFHTEQDVLRRLNPKARFTVGSTIHVPNVEPMTLSTDTKRRSGPGADASRVGSIVVSQSPPLAMVLDTMGALLFAAPVTSGSEHDPLPIGEWKVTDVYLLPVFHYNPALFWDAEPSHAKTTIKPGPNNPVGVAWIDIDREHYGLHGTPQPRIIGRSTSHGCVRLTNWDVTRLLAFVKPGTRILFKEQPVDLRSEPRTTGESGQESDIAQLRSRGLELPVHGVSHSQLVPSFGQARDGRKHEAIDIVAPRGTPVVAVEDGSIAKLFSSKPGGLTIYLFDPSKRYAFYYAHLDRYADGMKDGSSVKRGQILGYVGSTGNAAATQPHLHFTIFRLGPEHHWWEGTPIDPYPVFTDAQEPPHSANFPGE